MTALLVAAGGAAGTLARYAVGQWWPGAYSTVAINLAGSFLLGMLAGAHGFSGTTRSALGVGLLGGFTTYSTFTVQAVLFTDAGEPGRAAVYVIVSVLGGLACAFAGFGLARAL